MGRGGWRGVWRRIGVQFCDLFLGLVTAVRLCVSGRRERLGTLPRTGHV